MLAVITLGSEATTVTSPRPQYLQLQDHLSLPSEAQLPSQ